MPAVSDVYLYLDVEHVERLEAEIHHAWYYTLLDATTAAFIDQQCIGYVITSSLTFRTLSDPFHHILALKLPHHYACTSYTNAPIDPHGRYRRLRVEGIDHLHRGYGFLSIQKGLYLIRV
jgi:hypothetical protein